MTWKGESRRHSLSRKGIKTNIDDHKRLSVRNFVAKGYEGFSEIIHSQEYEGLDGYYFIKVFKDGRFELQTPSGLDLGKFDDEGYSHRAKYQEPDIEEWINSVGTDLVNNEGITFKAEGDFIPSNPQMNFEDLIKTPVQDRVGFRKEVTDYIVMKNGSKMSVQASVSHYSLPQSDEGNWTHIEVILYGKLRKRVPNGWKQYEIKFGGEPTGHYGYVPVEKVRAFINKNGGQKKVS